MSDRITVYGTSWCPDCKRAKRFLGEVRVPYLWVDIEKDSDAMELVERINDGKRIVPTIVFPDGGILRNPDNTALAQKLGLQTKAARTYYDVVIVGGGPTGLTAGFYAAREGLETLLIERSGLGGQAGVTDRLDNFPGFDEGIRGAEFAERLTRQARRFGVEILQSQTVSTIAQDGQYRAARTGDGQEYCAGAVLIATGSRYRRLNVPGESELIGVNIHFCATCDGAFYKGKELLVIGGGNSAFEESLFLTKFASRITIVEFEPEPKASKILQEKVAEKKDLIEVVTNHAVQEFLVEKGHLAGVRVQDRASGEVKLWHPEGVFVFIGLSPNSNWLPDEIERDRWGFVLTDDTLMTSMRGVFAAGDVRAGSTKQAASAVGEGATAALMMRQYLQQHGL